MKMPDSAFDDLLLLFREFDLLDIDARAACEYHTIGQNAKRYRWDRLYAIPFPARQAWFDGHAIYETMNDDHIDTALRKIFSHNRDIFIPQKAAKMLASR
jgi:hypothetical protein